MRSAVLRVVMAIVSLGVAGGVAWWAGYGATQVLYAVMPDSLDDVALGAGVVVWALVLWIVCRWLYGLMFDRWLF